MMSNKMIGVEDIRVDFGVGVAAIAAERDRQISDEEWSAERDDQHVNCELIRAAGAYCFIADVVSIGDNVWPRGEEIPPDLWPWSKSWWKPSKDPIRNLEKAGALIAAEIDRLKRQQSNSAASAPQR
jgi:hypothetical protein